MGDRTRRRRVMLICVLIGVVLIGTGIGIAVSVGRPGHPRGGPVTLSASPSTAPTAFPGTTDQAADGGRLRLVEQGFTQLKQSVTRTLTPGYGPNHPEPYQPVRVGIVVENTSRTQVAAAPKITVRYLDQTGKPVPEQWSGNGAASGPGAVFPGQRVGYVAFFSIDAVTVSRVDVQVLGASWMAPTEAAGWTQSPLTATGASLQRTGSPKVSVIAFTAHSGYRGMIGAVPVAIYRDPSGKIVGGSHFDQILGLQHYPPGTAAGSLTVTDWLPADLDPTHIDVYLSVAVGL
jgi:hypothetical protein